MTFVPIERGAVRLHGRDEGTGPCVLFQHGLGGAFDQVDEVSESIGGIRWLGLECRGHGLSPGGDERPFSLALLEGDLLAFLDQQRVGAFVAGGISMGAALALRLAVRDPRRVRALILVRPAWLFDGAPPSLQPLLAVAAALREASDAAATRGARARSPRGWRLADKGPQRPARLMSWFGRPDPRLTADLLTGLAADTAGVTREQVAALRQPALVIGQESDPLHPLATARTLAEALPHGRLVVVPPRERAKPAHRRAVREAVAGFLAALDPAA